MRVQISELEAHQAQLERERSQLMRRTASAEAQLQEMQEFVDTNLAKYQAEILRLNAHPPGGLLKR